MKRSKKPLTFTAIAAGIGALSMALEGCVYGPPQDPHETNVYGPPPPDVTQVTEETTKDTLPFKPSEDPGINETVVYGPPPDFPVDTEETDVYGPPPDAPVDEPEVGVYGPPPDVSIDGPEEDVYGPPPDADLN
ncbi:MAG: hypothetical protein K5779_10135 [Saccharofermentans sp.]|nr:hypothetical protein [Saccharofermentans sp.]